MRRWALAAMLLLAGCGPAPRPVASATPIEATPTATAPRTVVIPPAPLPTSHRLWRVAVLDQQNAVVAGDGVILRTVDGGTQWASVYQGSAQVRMLHWIDAANLVAATNLGLLVSHDAGAHWQMVNHRNDLVRLHFIDPSSGFAIAGPYPDDPGGYSTLEDAVAGTQLLRTSDGGATFRAVTTALPVVQWVQFVTPRQGWAAGPDGIETTMDGGSSWQVQLMFQPTLFRYDGRVWWGAQVGFRDELHGFAFYRAGQTVMSAGSGRLYYTDDGGLHWHLQSFISPAGPAPDEVGAPGGLPWSTNGELVVTGPASAMLLDTNGIVDRTELCATTDAGRTWNCPTLAFTAFTTGQLAARDGIEWMALTDDQGVAEIAISRDGGTRWHVDRFLIPGWPMVALPTPPAGAVGTWTDVGFLNYYHHGVWLAPRLQEGRVFACGGRWDQSTGCEIYDPHANAWSPAAPLLEPEPGPAVVLQSGDLLVFGTKAGQRYNPSTDRWVLVQGAVVRDTPCVAMLANGTLLVVAGRSPNAPTATDAAIYDPEFDRWSAAGSVTLPQVGCQAVSLPDGRVLVTGGDDPPSAKLYDPRTNAWKRTGPLHVDPRYPPVALAILPDGKVLAASSLPAVTESFKASGPPYVPGPRAELFDPQSGNWTPLADAPDNLPGQAVSLDDGRVLFIEGPLYDPVTNRWSPVAWPSLIYPAAVKLLDGRVLMVSGFRAFAYTAP